MLVKSEELSNSAFELVPYYGVTDLLADRYSQSGSVLLIGIKMDNEEPRNVPLPPSSKVQEFGTSQNSRLFRKRIVMILFLLPRFFLYAHGFMGTYIQ